MQKIISIIGARPQFIKVSSLAKKLRREFNHVLVHTGQHYDYLMSKVFFKNLDIPKPKYNLEIGSSRHGEQTGKMLISLEKTILKEKPNLVLVYGDTNSTLAGALAAAKLQIPLGHIEAGMRSFNKQMPEELNRITTDHLSDLLFCSSRISVNNLKEENINKHVYLVGDIMFDTLLRTLPSIDKKSTVLKINKLLPKQYAVLTIHRASNTDNKKNLSSIIDALIKSKEKIIFPVHPRTKKYIKKYNLLNKTKMNSIIPIEPLSYLDMIKLEKESKLILTDSGGIQKEAYFLKIPCVTLREETEWVETQQYGWNKLVGTNSKKILRSIKKYQIPKIYKKHYGSGKTSKSINNIISDFLKN